MIENPRLILFARYPAAGSCKTRLIPALGPIGAAAVHRRLTERTVEILRGCSTLVTVAFTGASHSAFTDWLGIGIEFSEQVEGDLTDKLLACLGLAPVIFLGADTPDLQAHHVNAAISGLQTHEVVIGPAEDGGYYLIGMRGPRPELFVDMPWSTEQVFPETLARLDRLGIVPLLLDTLADCDRPEDLARWPDLAT